MAYNYGLCLSSLFCQHDSKTEFHFLDSIVKAYVTFLSLCMLVNSCLPLLYLKMLLAVNKPTFCERFGVLTVMMMKITVIYDMTPNRLEYGYRSFVTAWCLHLYGPKVQLHLVLQFVCDNNLTSSARNYITYLVH